MESSGICQLVGGGRHCRLALTVGLAFVCLIALWSGLQEVGQARGDVVSARADGVGSPGEPTETGDCEAQSVR